MKKAIIPNTLILILQSVIKINLSEMLIDEAKSIRLNIFNDAFNFQVPTRDKVR